MKLTRSQWDELVAHAREDAPNECCGIVLMRDGAVETVRRATNERASPYGYSLDAKHLLEAFKAAEDGYTVGIYHSHPRSPAEPSQTDINLADYPEYLYVIVSLAGEPEVRAWWIRDERWTRRRWPSVAEPLACPSCALRYDLDERFCAKCGMPLVYVGAERTEAPEGSAHDRARKIDPRFTEGELVRVAGGRHQAEAELIQGMLLEEGVPSVLRRSAGFDVPDFLAAGPRDVLVPEAGAEVAREVLLQADMGPPSPEPGGSEAGRAARLLGVILAAGALTALIAWALLQLSS